MGLRLGIDLDGVAAGFDRGWMRAYRDGSVVTSAAGTVATWDGPFGLTHVSDAGQVIACDVDPDDTPDRVQRIAAARSIDAAVCRFVRPCDEPVDRAVDVRDRQEFDQVVREPASVLAG